MMGPNEEIRNGVLCWSHDNETWTPYTVEQLSARVVGAEKELHDLRREVRRLTGPGSGRGTMGW